MGHHAARAKEGAAVGGSGASGCGVEFEADGIREGPSIGGAMGGDDKGAAAVMVIAKGGEEEPGIAGVELGGGLVGEEERWLGGEGAGEGDALALAAGEALNGATDLRGAQSETNEQLASPADGLARRHPPSPKEGRGDRLLGAQPGRKQVMLKEGCHGGSAVRGKCGFREAGDLAAEDGEAAGGGAVEAAEEVQQGGLADAGGAENEEDGTPGDVEVDRGEGWPGTFVGAREGPRDKGGGHGKERSRRPAGRAGRRRTERKVTGNWRVAWWGGS